MFTVSASSSTPLTYQWRFNSNVIDGATSPILSLNNVNLTHNGAYDCVISDGSGSLVSSPATLLVAVPAFVTRHVQPIKAFVGETVTFTVEHRGHPIPNYRWRRGTTEVAPFSTATRTFSIANVQLSHAGNYSVVVSNIASLGAGALSPPGSGGVPNALLQVF